MAAFLDLAPQRRVGIRQLAGALCRARFELLAGDAKVFLVADALREVLGAMNYRNLDAEPDFAGRNTTTEYLARTVFDRLAARIREGKLGPSALSMASMRVTLPSRSPTTRSSCAAARRTLGTRAGYATLRA